MENVLSLSLFGLAVLLGFWAFGLWLLYDGIDIPEGRTVQPTQHIAFWLGELSLLTSLVLSIVASFGGWKMDKYAVEQVIITTLGHEIILSYLLIAALVLALLLSIRIVQISRRSHKTGSAQY